MENNATSAPLHSLVGRRLPRGKTEADAVSAGMNYSHDYECPECGCPWYANKDFCGKGHRTCYDCTQEWWEDVTYSNPHPRRELSETPNVTDQRAAKEAGHGK